MTQGKVEIEFGQNHLWVTAVLDPDGVHVTVAETWKQEPDKYEEKTWELHKEVILRDVGRRLVLAEGSRLN